MNKTKKDSLIQMNQGVFAIYDYIITGISAY